MRIHVDYNYKTLRAGTRIRLIIQGMQINLIGMIQINTTVRDIRRGLLAGKYHMSAICALRALDEERKTNSACTGTCGCWFKSLNVQIDVV
jgi:rRNA processing protein Krr1/Pno1